MDGVEAARLHRLTPSSTSTPSTPGPSEVTLRLVEHPGTSARDSQGSASLHCSLPLGS